MIFGFAWWLLAIMGLFSLALLFSVGNEYFTSTSVLTVFAGIAVYVLSGSPNLLYWAPIIFPNVIFWVIVYALVGVSWGIINWIIHTNSKRMQELIKDNYKQFTSQTGKTDFEDFIKSSYYPFGFSKDYPKIIMWVIWWPFSIVWSLTHDFLTTAFTWIGRQFSGFFAWIAKGATKNALKNKDK